jgi:hypothetical protein
MPASIASTHGQTDEKAGSGRGVLDKEVVNGRDELQRIY